MKSQQLFILWVFQCVFIGLLSSHLCFHLFEAWSIDFDPINGAKVLPKSSIHQKWLQINSNFIINCMETQGKIQRQEDRTIKVTYVQFYFILSGWTASTLTWSTFYCKWLVNDKCLTVFLSVCLWVAKEGHFESSFLFHLVFRILGVFFFVCVNFPFFRMWFVFILTFSFVFVCFSIFYFSLSSFSDSCVAHFHSWIEIIMDTK